MVTAYGTKTTSSRNCAGRSERIFSFFVFFFEQTTQHAHSRKMLVVLRLVIVDWALSALFSIIMSRGWTLMISSVACAFSSDIFRVCALTLSYNYSASVACAFISDTFRVRAPAFSTIAQLPSLVRAFETQAHQWHLRFHTPLFLSF